MKRISFLNNGFKVLNFNFTALKLFTKLTKQGLLAGQNNTWGRHCKSDIEKSVSIRLSVGQMLMEWRKCGVACACKCTFIVNVIC